MTTDLHWKTIFQRMRGNVIMS